MGEGRKACARFNRQIYSTILAVSRRNCGQKLKVSQGGFCIKVISHGNMNFPKPAPTNIGFCLKVISNGDMNFPKRFTAYVEKL
ncbi:hypothetical protein MC7420_4444 [Coleofasciculus chthonoplastes PCC 7420]|uniref:Uncharacterized protein n=1 Tax=Coleofasciculus chthonoplastes PCC 7420 TaxID=118168 RepID=B4VXZ7_9CYAN|nr:hypothetical protein MC7420_4444 [Coleofasciculus chthonoplastes PCC 7420]